jgi:hypothetical protein
VIVVCGEALIDIVDAGDGALRPMPMLSVRPCSRGFMITGL